MFVKSVGRWFENGLGGNFDYKELAVCASASHSPVKKFVGNGFNPFLFLIYGGIGRQIGYKSVIRLVNTGRG